MPRKKLTEPTPTTPELELEATPAPEKPKKTTRAKKTTEPVVAPAPETKAAATKAKPKPAAKKVAEPVVVVAEEPKAPRAKIGATKKVAAPVVTAKAKPAAPKKVAPAPTPEPTGPITTKAKIDAFEEAKARFDEIVLEPDPEPEPIVVKAEPAPKTRIGRAKKTEAPAPVAATETVDFGGDLVVSFRPRVGGAVKEAPAKQAEPKRGEKPSRQKAAASASAAEPEVFIGLRDENDMPIPNWRPRQKPPVNASKEEGDENGFEGGEESEDQGLSPRRSRRRRRKEFQGAEITAEGVVEAPEPAAAPVVTVRKAPELPKIEVKPAIPIPDDAPQIVLRAGIPTLVRNHRVYPPIMFFGSPSDERRAATVLDELRMAGDAGVHLHSYLVDLEVDSAATDAAVQFAAYILAKSVEIDPESQVVFRVAFLPPRNWEDKYTKGRYRAADGSTPEPSVCDEEFWGTAANCLEIFVKKLRMLDLNYHILGVHLERGEWFMTEGQGYDTSRAAQDAFRNWTRTRYLNDEVTLRASWFDGTVSFDNIQIPEFQPEGAEGEKFVRSSRKQRRYVDYHLFLSDATVHRISELAYVAKAASDGYFLVGACYGYTFEWSHPSNSHLGLGKLLRCQEIDFIAGPPSYRNREPGGTAPFPGPIDSFALNGKLYISEEDYKTSLSSGHEPDDFNPALKTPQALESVHWRGAGAALAHASGLAWMDQWGNGWLKTASVWERAAKLREVLTDRMEAPLGDPEVAVFIDERALAYLVDPNAFTLLVQNVRESVLRAGVSAAFYLLSDLAHREKFPESKLYLFVNAWDIRPELRAAIKSRLQREGKVLFWLYAAGLFDAGRDSLERAREVTGIALKPQPYYSKAGTTILNRRHPLSEAFPDRSLIGGTKLEPSYFAIPENATVLGEYSQTGLPSFVVKEFKEGPAETHWTSVFLGEPLVNPALIRALAQMAGAHVWNFHEDVVHVRAPFCTVHCSGAGPRTITLPSKYSAYNLLTSQWTSVDSSNLRFTAVDGSTHVFLVGPKEDLTHFLERDPSAALRMEELPPRELNIRTDNANFDVPIMKLDEWIEGGDEEVPEDWFLRAPQIVDEGDQPEADNADSEKVGRRRRRRRRPGNDREGTEELITARAEPSGTRDGSFDDIGMNVLFRKRE